MLVPIHAPVWRLWEHCKSAVSCLRTKHSVSDHNWAWTARSGGKHTKHMRPQRLPIFLALGHIFTKPVSQNSVVCPVSPSINLLISCGSLDYFDNVMTKFIVNNRTDACETDTNLFFMITNCKIVCSGLLTRPVNYKFMHLSLIMKISQWTCKNFCSYSKKRYCPTLNIQLGGERHFRSNKSILLRLASCSGGAGIFLVN